MSPPDQVIRQGSGGWAKGATERAPPGGDADADAPGRGRRTAQGGRQRGGVGWRIVDGFPTAWWPWDPRFDVTGMPLAAGQYVIVVGSVVTDDPHSGARPGYAAILLSLDSVRSTPNCRTISRQIPGFGRNGV